MQFFIIQSKKRHWTNAAGRDALGIGTGSQVKITAGNRSKTLHINRAPAAASRVMRAAQALTGLFGIAVDRQAMSDLQVKPGDKVQVLNLDIATVQRTASSTLKSRMLVSGGTEKVSLFDRLNSLKIGEEATVSESAAKSGAYSVAKKVGITIKKTSPTTVRRVA